MLECAALLRRSPTTTADARACDFVFDNCAAAAEAFRERLPRLAELVKAIAIAELEAKGRYVEAEHDAFFERFDEHALTADDLALLPRLPRLHSARSATTRRRTPG